MKGSQQPSFINEREPGKEASRLLGSLQYARTARCVTRIEVRFAVSNNLDCRHHNRLNRQFDMYVKELVDQSPRFSLVTLERSSVAKSEARWMLPSRLEWPRDCGRESTVRDCS